MTAGPLRTWLARHPRVAGLGLALMVLAGYVAVLRPVRLWTAAHVASPLLQRIDTPASRERALIRLDRRPDAVFVVPRSAAAGDVDGWVRAHEPPQWAAPVGVIFLLPAMLLAAMFPHRPYWLYLLAYHVALGVVAFGVFGVGVAGWEPAFKVYTFARTYLAETISLVVPLLLVLAARTSGREQSQ